jgi:hypothetical protein
VPPVCHFDLTSECNGTVADVGGEEGEGWSQSTSDLDPCEGSGLIRQDVERHAIEIVEDALVVEIGRNLHQEAVEQVNKR